MKSGRLSSDDSSALRCNSGNEAMGALKLSSITIEERGTQPEIHEVPNREYKIRNKLKVVQNTEARIQFNLFILKNKTEPYHVFS